MTDNKVPYRIIFSRRRSIGIIISPNDGVIVRAPHRTSLNLIQRFVDSKSAWIKKHTENHSMMTRLNPKDTREGSELLYRGKRYILKVETSMKQNVTLEDDLIIVALKEVTGDGISKILDKWYRKQAKEIITGSFADLLRRFESYRFTPTGLSVKPMKRRWGSCGISGKIAINSELIKLADIYTEYVVLHELCHLKHHNHGREFYDLLSEVFPRWKETRKELRTFLT